MGMGKSQERWLSRVRVTGYECEVLTTGCDWTRCFSLGVLGSDALFRGTCLDSDFGVCVYGGSLWMEKSRSGKQALKAGRSWSTGTA